MRRWTISIVICALYAVAVWAQGNNPPPVTQKPGDTPVEAGKSAPAHSGEKAAHKAKGAGGTEKTLRGCLSPSDAGTFMLTRGAGKKKVEVGAGEGVDLRAHVGHEVKLTGAYFKSARTSAEEKGEKHFHVSKVEHVSDTCTSTAAAAKKPSSGAPK